MAFRLIIKPFMDAWTWDEDRIDRWLRFARLASDAGAGAMTDDDVLHRNAAGIAHHKLAGHRLLETNRRTV